MLGVAAFSLLLSVTRQRLCTPTVRSELLLAMSVCCVYAHLNSCGDLRAMHFSCLVWGRLCMLRFLQSYLTRTASILILSQRFLCDFSLSFVRRSLHAIIPLIFPDTNPTPRQLIFFSRRRSQRLESSCLFEILTSVSCFYLHWQISACRKSSSYPCRSQDLQHSGRHKLPRQGIRFWSQSGTLTHIYAQRCQILIREMSTCLSRHLAAVQSWKVRYRHSKTGMKESEEVPCSNTTCALSLFDEIISDPTTVCCHLRRYLHAQYTVQCTMPKYLYL